MDQPRKATARRFLEETPERDRMPAYAHLCTDDYLEHDPAMTEETVGRDQAARTYEELVTAFGLRHTPESMVAEGDLVCARFTTRGRHTGEYRGLPPTGGTVEVPGHVTFRFQGEKIAETWFNWDLQGLMEQLGRPTDTAM